MHSVVATDQARRAVISLWSITVVLTSVMPVGAESPGNDPDTRRRGQLSRVKHIIVVMQENHSFDNYFGVLPYAPGSPYRRGPCHADDHACVDGLACSRDPKTGAYHCQNTNRDDDKAKKVRAFHLADYCVKTDLDHSWVGTHKEVNFSEPNAGPGRTPNDGFVLVNDLTNQPDNGVESPTDDQTMGFYNEDDLGFYYDLARVFALSDRHFSAVLGPTFPNRASTRRSWRSSSAGFSRPIPTRPTSPRTRRI